MGFPYGKGRKIGEEELVQRACIEFLERCVPPPPEGPLYCFADNGTKKSKAAGGIAKAMGLRAGWPDLPMALSGGGSAYFEFKSSVGELSKEQETVHSLLRQMGHTVYVTRSLDDFRVQLRELGVRTREAHGAALAYIRSIYRHRIARVRLGRRTPAQTRMVIRARQTAKQP